MYIIQTFIFTLLIKDRQTVHSYVSQLRQKKTGQGSFGCMSGVKALHVLILLHFLESIDISSETILLCTLKLFFSVVFYGSRMSKLQ